MIKFHLHNVLSKISHVMVFTSQSGELLSPNTYEYFMNTKHLDSCLKKYFAGIRELSKAICSYSVPNISLKLLFTKVSHHKLN